MSTNTQTEPGSTKVECGHPDCEAVGRKWEFRHGKYCSTACETRDEGLEALRRFKFDHCRCFSCLRRLKTVTEPKPDFEFTERGHGWTRNPETGELRLQFFSQEVTRQAAVGHQHLEPDAGKGEKQRSGVGAGQDRVVTGTICEACGQTDHTEHDPIVADRRAVGRLVTLFSDVEETVIDAETLHREYADHRDLQLAVGRALQDD